MSLTGLTPRERTTLSASSALFAPVLTSSTSTLPGSMPTSFVPVINFVPKGLIRSISSSTSWNHAPGATSGAISMTVTSQPASLRNSVTSRPVMPEPTTTTFLFSIFFSPMIISGARTTVSRSMPGMDLGRMGVPPVATTTA